LSPCPGWANPEGEEEREPVTRGKLCCLGTLVLERKDGVE
jgi:hypothetical protein